MLLRMAEVFGFAVDNLSNEARDTRHGKRCPFRGASCNKTKKDDPLGICTLANEGSATVICPNRFLEGSRLFADAGRLAFGPGARVAAIPEIRVLRVPHPDGVPRKIGKIDFMLAALDEGDRPVDFAALEVQAVYISGRSMRGAFENFLSTDRLGAGSERRPDFRSSAQKRLMPQLSLKVPVFRRWGKKFFVAVDETFFQALPSMPSLDGIENSEVTWLVYPFARSGASFVMGEPRVVFTVWDEVVSALREGHAPLPSEMLDELRRNLPRATNITTAH